MSDRKHYIIIVLVVSLVLLSEAVAHVRILYVVATMTHTNLHSSSITYALDVSIQLCSNCTLISTTPIYAPFRPQCNFLCIYY